MKIELYGEDPEGNFFGTDFFARGIVKEYKKQGKEYSILFREYEIVFIPETKEDIGRFGRIFSDRFKSSSGVSEVNIILKKDNKICWNAGKYSWSEIHSNTTNGKYDGVLSIHIATKDYHEYDIYFLLEGEETYTYIFDKVFHR